MTTGRVRIMPRAQVEHLRFEERQRKDRSLVILLCALLAGLILGGGLTVYCVIHLWIGGH